MRDWPATLAGGTLFALVIAAILIGGQVLAWALGVGE